MCLLLVEFEFTRLCRQPRSKLWKMRIMPSRTTKHWPKRPLQVWQQKRKRHESEIPTSTNIHQHSAQEFYPSQLDLLNRLCWGWQCGGSHHQSRGATSQHLNLSNLISESLTILLYLIMIWHIWADLSMTGPWPLCPKGEELNRNHGNGEIGMTWVTFKADSLSHQVPHRYPMGPFFFFRGNELMPKPTARTSWLLWKRWHRQLERCTPTVTSWWRISRLVRVQWMMKLEASSNPKPWCKESVELQTLKVEYFSTGACEGRESRWRYREINRNHM